MHKVSLAIIVVWVSCLGPGAAAADYILFGKQADEAARTLTSIQSCKRMGFKVDDRRDVPAEISDMIIRRGVMQGIDRTTAESMALDALQREQADMELISRPPESADTTQELIVSVRENVAFWNERCEALALGELSGHYVQRTGNEADIQAQLIARVTEQIETASRSE